ncbi:unnamed protein product [Trichogramma brassicae]|uniref:Uncharacterized protein n=1 Tax=Trichogramma brassicae TaxID=86971 RepID=A0A6H5IL28_9HYME|nr:unnamed protein product [Trichogramma brassicae]
MRSEKSFAKILFEISDEKNQTLLVNARDTRGNTPLFYALDGGNKELVELLLRRGADPNSANDSGSTPLHACLLREHMMETFYEICDELDQRVRVDAKYQDGQTPLYRAVLTLKPKIVDVLLDHGAAPIRPASFFRPPRTLPAGMA